MNPKYGQKQTVMILLSLMLIISFLLSGCKTASPTIEATAATQVPSAVTDSPTKSPTEAPKTLIITAFGIAQTIDPDEALGHPSSVEAMVNILEPLIDYKMVPDSNGNLVPDYTQFEPRLAESWDVSADKRTWTFHVRHGVMSVWGNEFTSDDYKWSVERAFADKSWGWFLATAGGIASGDSVNVIDKYTFSITTPGVNPIFLMTKALFYMGIYDSTEAKKHITTDDPWAHNWLRRNPCSYGPYAITSWVVGQEIDFVARDDYYRGPAKIKNVILREVPTSSNRLALLLDGTTQLTRDLAPSEFDKVKSSSGNRVAFVPGDVPVDLILNAQYPGLDNVKVRQAIAYAIPYQEIAQKVFLGYAEPAHSFVAPTFPNVTDKFGYTTNLDKAKSLLAEAGYSNGLSFKVLYSSADNTLEETAIVLQTQFAQIGINITLDKETPAVIEDRKMKKSEPAYLSNAEIAWLPDVAYHAGVFLTTNAVVNPGWSNAEFDSLYTQALQTDDPAIRLPLLTRLQEIQMTEIPFVPIVWVGRPVALSNRVTGYSWYPDNALRYYDLDLTP
jgi:peptide/nickel transport system substrate-binding protein